MATLPVVIAGRKIGPGHPPYIVAEISSNHGGSFARAISLINAAYKAGANAVKLQTYTPESMTIDHNGPGFILSQGLWHGQKLWDIYTKNQTPREWHEKLFTYAKAIGITLFSTPFSISDVDFLADLDVPAYKVASFEIIDLALISHIATKDKPIIISTGMANITEIKAAMKAAEPCPVILLHCISAYPAPVEDMQLNQIKYLSARFRCVVGLSDHSLGSHVAVTATVLGASMIEKHFKLRDEVKTSDATFSITPNELKTLTATCAEIWKAPGRSYKEDKSKADYINSESPQRGLRRSLYAVQAIAKGELFTNKNVQSIRPGLGLAPKFFPRVLNSTATKSIPFGTPLTEAMLGPKKPRVVCITQARMGSSRLPGKVMLQIAGKTVLQHHLERAKKAKLVDKLVVATTTKPCDDIIVQQCKELNIAVFRGQELDVLNRYACCAREHNADIIVRITSDCPLVDPEVIDKVIEDYLFNSLAPDFIRLEPGFYPKGFDVEVFSIQALEKAERSADVVQDLEDVTRYIYKREKEFVVCNFRLTSKTKFQNFSIDTPADFKFVSWVLEHVQQAKDLDFTWQDCLDIPTPDDFNAD